jgi:hypothetical protein
MAECRTSTVARSIVQPSGTAAGSATGENQGEMAERSVARPYEERQLSDQPPVRISRRRSRARTAQRIELVVDCQRVVGRAVRRRGRAEDDLLAAERQGMGGACRCEQEEERERGRHV